PSGAVRGLTGCGEVELVRRDERRALSEAASLALELDVDRGDVLERIRPRSVDDMHEQARTLDVPKELLAEPEAAARALDGPGDVGDDKLAIVETRNTEIRDERREQVVRDLRVGTGESREKGRLSRV